MCGMNLVGAVSRLDIGAVVRLRPRQKSEISMTLKEIFQTLLLQIHVGGIIDEFGTDPGRR